MGHQNNGGRRNKFAGGIVENKTEAAPFGLKQEPRHD